MPVAKGGKAPLLCHRGGSWTWAQYDALDKSKDVDYAIILQELAVIDVDSEEQARLLAERFPALRVAPRESTRRGMHFFFARSSACAALRGAAGETRGRDSGERRVSARARARARDALSSAPPAATDRCDVEGFYDGAGQVERGIDFKSVSRSGTGGIIVVGPSTDKVRRLWARGTKDAQPLLCQPSLPHPLRGRSGKPRCSVRRHPRPSSPTTSSVPWPSRRTSWWTRR